MAIKLSVSPEVEIKTRIQVLHDVIKELSHSFGVGSDTIQSIKKGVLERQIFEKITIYYFNTEDEVVGRITFTIDWGLHEIYADDESGNSYKIDKNKTLNEQLADWNKHIVEHINRMKSFFEVKRNKVIYTYRKEIRNDSVKHQEAREFLGHSLANEDYKWAKNINP